VISDLDEAWQWYQSVKDLSRVMARLGRRYWDRLPWDGILDRDETLKEVESSQINEMTRTVLDDLEDLCVHLLFSVFEATVRERVLADLENELPDVRHPALIQAIKNLNETIEHGSFYRVLESYKGLDPHLVEEVNQVRRYRNWVAHGRRGEQPDNVSPAITYIRLKRFLERLGDIEAS
jgi:hypothetical protein